MALPTILVNATGGSDTQASGAGPATALFGTTDASTDGAGTTVTLTAGTDLSGVATDGSHVIYLADTTAGARNFGKITGSAGSGGATPTVTVANAFGLTLSGKSWAIGGKRASIGSTTSKKLIVNNGTNGDAMPGWIMEMESGHAETISTINFDFIRSGDVTSGPIILRGTSGAGTKPILTNDQNASFIRGNGASRIQLRDFEIRNTNATKTASIAIAIVTAGTEWLISGIVVDHSTNKFWKAITAAGASTGFLVERCQIGYCANIGVDSTLSGGRPGRIEECYIHDCGSHGLSHNNAGCAIFMRGCIVYKNTGSGISVSSSGTGGDCGGVGVEHCTIDANTADGITISAANEAAWNQLIIENNEISNNGGYGINGSGPPVAALLAACNVVIRNNGIYTNTGGPINPAALDAIDTGTVTTDPGYTGPASSGGNWAIGTNHKAIGYSTAALPGTATTSYVDPGAAQRQEAASGGGLLRPVPQSGGLV